MDSVRQQIDHYYLMSPSKEPPNDPETTVVTAITSPVIADRKECNYHAHFDCFSGAAGDMLLASCLDASGDPDHLKDHVTKCLAMGMPALADEFQIRTKKVWRGGMGSIAGMHVTVVSRYNDKPAPVPKRKMDDDHDDDDDRRLDHKPSNHHDHEYGRGRGHGHHHEHGHGHGHQHGQQHHSSTVGTQKKEPEPCNNTNGDLNQDPESHSNDHSHSHAHSHSHSQNNSSHTHHKNHSPSSSHSDGPLRNLTEIRRLLEESDDNFIAPWVKAMAIATFTELAKAEATTHGAESIEAVHFHEVGAVDSIVDTVGTLIALHYLGVTTFSCSRIPIGEGTVWTDHGILPVPAPATLRLLVGMPTCPGPMRVVTGELVTPTGAALLRTLCLIGETKTKPPPKLTGRPPNFTIRKIGIGAGTKDFERHPNILRLLIGDDVVTK
jgi:uncharacterized protein (DUF111 family)